MGNFWIKVALGAVIVGGVIVAIGVFSKQGGAVKSEQKTFYDVVRSDDERLRADVRKEQSEKQEELAQQEATAQQPKFKELSEEDRVQAEKLFEMAVAQRKIARLPGMSYKPMIDYCRQIIEKYSGSSYAAGAKRMLGEVPARYRELYGITEQETAQ